MSDWIGEGIVEGIHLRKGYKLIIHNIEWAEISRIRLKATDKSKECITVEKEEDKK